MSSDLQIEVTPWIQEKNWWKIKCYFKDNAMFTVWTPDLTLEHGNKTQTMGCELKVENASGTQATNTCTETSGGKLKGHHLLLSIIIIDMHHYFLKIPSYSLVQPAGQLRLAGHIITAVLSVRHRAHGIVCSWYKLGNILPWWWYSTALIMLPPAPENELYSGPSLGKPW